MKNIKRFGLLCAGAVLLTSCNSYKEVNLSSIIDFINNTYISTGKMRKEVKEVYFNAVITDMPNDKSKELGKAELSRLASKDTGYGINYDSNTFQIVEQKIDITTKESQTLKAYASYVIDEALIAEYEAKKKDTSTDYVKYFVKGNEMRVESNKVYNVGKDENAHNINSNVKDDFNSNGQMEKYHTVRCYTYKDNSTFKITSDVRYVFYE